MQVLRALDYSCTSMSKGEALGATRLATSGALFDRWAGFWRSWTNRVPLFKNIEVDYLLRAAHHTP